MTAPELIWIPRETDDGSWTLVHAGLDEACHSRAGAWLEAVERYVVPTALEEVAFEHGVARLLDVGTGVGWNLAAALRAATHAGGRLEVLSLECEPSVLGAARALPREGEPGRFLDEVQAALERAERDGRVERPLPAGGTWSLELRLGPAPRTLAAASGAGPFDGVFLDPFSPGKTGPECEGAESPWHPAFLAAVAGRMAPVSRLSTYTSALSVRVALARAGLSVGAGPRVGDKASGTLAGRGVALRPLAARTARRLAARLAPRPESGG